MVLYTVLGAVLYSTVKGFVSGFLKGVSIGISGVNIADLATAGLGYYLHKKRPGALGEFGLGLFIAGVSEIAKSLGFTFTVSTTTSGSGGTSTTTTSGGGGGGGSGMITTGGYSIPTWRYGTLLF